MAHQKKYYSIWVFIALNFSLYGNKFADTSNTLSSNIGNKFSLGISASLFSLMNYELLNYSNLNPEPSGSCAKCESYKKPKYSGQIFDMQSLNSRYAIKDYFKINIVISNRIERIGFGNQNIDSIRMNVIKIKNIGSIENKYFGISPSLILSIRNNKKGLFNTSIEAGVIFDLIYNENYYHSSENIDSIYSPYASSNFIVLNEKKLNENPRKNKPNFNRISPFIYLGLEWYSKKKVFSFSVGSSIVFRSVYQQNNTREFYKSYKITPIVLGVNYHFK